jgi:hypothetical protein
VAALESIKEIGEVARYAINNFSETLKPWDVKKINKAQPVKGKTSNQ